MYRAHYKNSRSNARLSACAKHREANGRFSRKRAENLESRTLLHTLVIIWNFFEKYFSILEKSILIRSRWKIKNITLMDPFEFFKLEDFKIISGLM